MQFRTSHQAAAGDSDKAGIFGVSKLPENELLTWGCGTRVVPQNMQLIAMPGDVFRLDRYLILQAGIEGGSVGELDMDLGTVLAVLVDGQYADYFVGKFFTFDHRFSRGSSVVRL